METVHTGTWHTVGEALEAWSSQFYWARWNSGHGVKWHHIHSAGKTECGKPVPAYAIIFRGVVRESLVCKSCIKSIRSHAVT